jgi:hypothetical protein
MVVADLDGAVGPDHPDRPAIDRLRGKGAALTAADRDEVNRLASKHGMLLDHSLASAETADDVLDAGEVREATARLREAGVPMTGYVAEAESRELTPLASLVESGVPMKPAGTGPMR